MNDGEFENMLRAFTSALHRPDPAPAWKVEILARARREAAIRSPRWLLACLGLAWAFAAFLRITTPDTSGGERHAGNSSARIEANAAAPDSPDTPFRALIALQSNPEYPDHP